MREIYKGGLTPQQKIVAVNNKFGNNDIKQQQGTTRILYDTLPALNTTTFRFFEDSASRSFPDTNTGSDGNKLGVGDSMVVQSIMLEVVYKDSQNGLVYEVTPFASLEGGSDVFWQLSMLDFEIGNNKVLKKVTWTEALEPYNKSAQGNADLELETLAVIPPLVPFQLILTMAGALTVPVLLPPTAVPYIRCSIIGAGSLLAPRTTF